MLALIIALVLAQPPQATLPADRPTPKQAPDAPPVRLRCTDGTLIERTATGWRVVGSNYSEFPNSSTNRHTVSGCQDGNCPIPQRKR